MSDALIIEKLSDSFDRLDDCIRSTQLTLKERQNVPQDVRVRVESYGEIVLKQRKLLGNLRVYLNNNNWTEVGRHIRLIDSLSSMIREDAQAILGYPRSEESLLN